ncbi:MAG: class I SAM-dependent methyltransferase [Phycisphaeraceae bacterium]|nr:class I SAM-dependent methyltransferase [Phycisphaeraceae bacterium]
MASVETGSRSKADQASPSTAIPTFEELSRSYNFQTLPSRQFVFVKLLRDEMALRTRPVRALDVGCGKGIHLDAGLSKQVRESADELYGIEPDPTITPETGLFDHFQHARMEDAALPADHFDVVFSSMVMEHVTDPETFLRAARRCLKPGGVFMFLTINGSHYFARLANLARSMRLEEVVLRLVRGRQEVESYHYPTAYRFNRASQIEPVARGLGFEDPEYVFVEGNGPIHYLPGPLRLLLYVMHSKRRIVRDPRCLMELICRIRRPK